MASTMEYIENQIDADIRETIKALVMLEVSKML